jgi:hypothetical protein
MFPERRTDCCGFRPVIARRWRFGNPTWNRVQPAAVSPFPQRREILFGTSMLDEGNGAAVVWIRGNVNQPVGQYMPHDTVRHEPALAHYEPATNNFVPGMMLNKRFAIRMAAVRLRIGPRFAGDRVRDGYASHQIIEVSRSRVRTHVIRV